ncbi:hypothetical protein GCM10010191_52200 [Actinomadura vinacea]|uniref:Novel STAND NTPase 1 domain-containing protein n=1 Tax=Actinomadura vinacea TaxID=115336 RepID=A0ABN3JJQ1_9ACTN
MSDGERALSLPSGDGDDVCPYQGLAPFETETSDLFFGRAQATRGLLARLGPRLEAQGSVLLVSGASGVGKSSLLRAGLLPELARGTLPVAGSETWPRLLVTPTSEPLRALAEAWTEEFGGNAGTVRELLRDDPRGALTGPLAPPGRLVLVVDQFEELFTLVTGEEERQAFVRALHALAEGPPGAGVVIGVRADYWDRCAAYPQFAEAIQDGQVIVEPMTESDLRLAITGPAASVDLELEPGLVETILAELRAGRDAADRYEPGALPLLSQALRNTWERREKRRLTVRGYEESGRVRDSVRRTADEVLDRLPAEDRKTALRLFRRMTVISAGGRVVRRRATLAEMRAAASAHTAEQRDRVGALLSAFAEQRLITLHEDAVEIAHDALLTAWPTLRQWLEPDLAAQEVYDRLVDDAAQWAENHRDPAFLYRGARLLSVQDTRPRWDRDPDSFPPPGPIVEGFIAASMRAARRAGRRRRLVMAGLAVLTVVALIAAVAAVDAAGDADRQRRLAVSRQLAAQSEIAGDPTISSLLAVAAWRIAPTAEARYRMLDAATRPGRGSIKGDGRTIIELAFSPDGSKIATAHEQEGVVRFWDTASRRQVGAPIDAKSITSCLAGFDIAFSPDGKTLVTSCFRFIRFWDVATRRPLGPLLDAAMEEPIGGVQTLAFSPDGRTLATSNYEGTTLLWDVATRRRTGGPFGEYQATGKKSIKAMAWTPDGKRLVTAGLDDTARLWDTVAGRQVGDGFTGHTDDVHDLSISPDGTTLATASTDGTARLWNLATQKEIGTLRDPDRRGAVGGFRGIAFSPDGKRLVTAGEEGITRLWDVADRRPVGPVLGDKRQRVKRVAFSPDGRTVAAAGDAGAVWLWDPLAHRQVGAAMPASSDAVFSPDGKTLVTPRPEPDASGYRVAEGALQIWDVATQRRVGRPMEPAGRPALYDVEFDAAGRTLTTRTADGTIRRWDTATQRQIGSPIPSDTNAMTARFSPDDRLLAVQRSVEDRSIAFWDIAGRREVGPRITVPGFTDNIWEMRFSPDGATLALAGKDRSVRFFDVATHRQVGAPMPAAVGGGYFDHLAFSPDGRTLASTPGDGTVRLWDVAARRQIGDALTGHTDFITEVQFSPDGKTLVSGSADGTLRLWDVATHRQIGPALTGHDGRVTGLDVGPDGTVVSVGGDRTARLWNVAIPADPAATACANAGRSFTRAEWARYVPGEEFQRVCR